MQTVSAYQAKTHLSRLLDDVARGETITITRHGAPVAMLVPPPDKQRVDVAELIEEWKRYQREQNITLGGLSIREMIEEGRQ